MHVCGERLRTVEKMRVEVARPVGENGCTVVGEWLGAILSQSTLSTGHAARGNIAVHPLIRTCREPAIVFTLIAFPEKLS